MPLEASGPIIVITVQPDGKMTVEVQGAVGPSCKNLSKPYEDMFLITGDSNKPEFHRAETRASQQQKL
jgi:hypothetical protein